MKISSSDSCNDRNSIFISCVLQSVRPVSCQVHRLQQMHTFPHKIRVIKVFCNRRKSQIPDYLPFRSCVFQAHGHFLRNSFRCKSNPRPLGRKTDWSQTLGGQKNTVGKWDSKPGVIWSCHGIKFRFFQKSGANFPPCLAVTPVETSVVEYDFFKKVGFLLRICRKEVSIRDRGFRRLGLPKRGERKKSFVFFWKKSENHWAFAKKFWI